MNGQGSTATYDALGASRRGEVPRLRPLRPGLFGEPDSARDSNLEVFAADALLCHIVETLAESICSLHPAAAWDSVSRAEQVGARLQTLAKVLFEENAFGSTEKQKREKKEALRSGLDDCLVAESPEDYVLDRWRQLGSEPNWQDLEQELEKTQLRLVRNSERPREAKEALDHIVHLTAGPARGREVFRAVSKAFFGYDPDRKLKESEGEVGSAPTPQVITAMHVMVAYLGLPTVRRWALGRILLALSTSICQTLKSEAVMKPAAESAPRAEAEALDKGDGEEKPPPPGHKEPSYDGPDSSGWPALTNGPDSTSGPRALRPCPPPSLFRGRTGEGPSRLICLMPAEAERNEDPFEPIDAVRVSPRQPALYPTPGRVTARVLAEGPPITFLIRDGLDASDLVLLEGAMLEYKRANKPYRSREHTVQDPKTLPPLAPSSMRVGCGHRDCGEDISGLDRRERICPGCQQPIRSRCGHEDCREDFLHLDSEGRGTHCPTCERTIINRFWTCSLHPEVGLLSREADPICPECLSSAARPAAAKRPDRLQRGLLICPGCLKQERVQPFIVPQRLMELYGIGVVPRRPEHEELFRAAGLCPDGTCPRCRAQLIAFESIGDRESRPTRLRCGHCGLPATMDEKSCTRCREALGDCPICARLPQTPGRPLERWLHRRGRRVRCERCMTYRYSLRQRLDFEKLDGKVCTNLYACPVGGGLADGETAVLLPASCTFCPVCEDLDCRPLDVRAFLGAVRRCDHCLATMGDPRTWTRDSLATALPPDLDIEASLAAMVEPRVPCRLCGRGGPGRSIERSEVMAATLELARLLWIGHGSDESRSRARCHWRAADPDWQDPATRRGVAQLLADQTPARHHHQLAELLDRLLLDLDAEDGTLRGLDLQRA